MTHILNVTRVIRVTNCWVGTVEKSRGRIPKSQLKVSVIFIDQSYFIQPSQQVLKTNWATYVSADGKKMQLSWRSWKRAEWKAFWSLLSSAPLSMQQESLMRVCNGRDSDNFLTLWIIHIFWGQFHKMIYLCSKKTHD